MNALGAIALGAPIGMQYVSFFVVWTFQITDKANYC